MSDHRAHPRMRTLKSGSLVLSDKAPKIECTVRNVSPGGACVQVSTTFGIPSNFDFILDGVRHHCRVAWMRETRIGIAYI
jgi:hypothetical protein